MKDHSSHTVALRKQAQRCFDTLRSARQHTRQLQALSQLLPFNQDARRSLAALEHVMPQLDAALDVLAPLTRAESGR